MPDGEKDSASGRRGASESPLQDFRAFRKPPSTAGGEHHTIVIRRYINFANVEKVAMDKIRLETMHLHSQAIVARKPPQLLEKQQSQCFITSRPPINLWCSLQEYGCRY